MDAFLPNDVVETILRLVHAMAMKEVLAELETVCAQRRLVRKDRCAQRLQDAYQDVWQRGLVDRADDIQDLRFDLTYWAEPNASHDDILQRTIRWSEDDDARHGIHADLPLLNSSDGE